MDSRRARKDHLTPCNTRHPVAEQRDNKEQATGKHTPDILTTEGFYQNSTKWRGGGGGGEKHLQFTALTKTTSSIQLPHKSGKERPSLRSSQGNSQKKLKKPTTVKKTYPHSTYDWKRNNRTGVGDIVLACNPSTWEV